MHSHTRKLVLQQSGCCKNERGVGGTVEMLRDGGW